MSHSIPRLHSHPSSTEQELTVASFDALALLGDAAAILLAVVLVRLAGLVAEPGTAIRGTLTVTVPFLLGWFAVAIPLGAYRRRAFCRMAWTLRHTATAWILGGMIGLVLRVAVAHRPITSPFALTLLGSGLVLLLAWRLLLLVSWRRAPDTPDIGEEPGRPPSGRGREALN